MPPRRRAPTAPLYGRALLLFALTFLCTTTLSPVMCPDQPDGRRPPRLPPFLTPAVVSAVWRDPEMLRIGLAFAIPALFILLCHEMGHYVACRIYRIPCTLPFFLPVPINFGTFGAFIRIKAPIHSKRQLFDVGVAGPIAGFVALVPFLLYGIAHSQPVPGQPGTGAMDLLLPGHCLAIAARRSGSSTALWRRGRSSTSTPPRSPPGSACSPPRSTCCRSASSTAATSSTPRPAACSGASPSPSGSPSPCSASTGAGWLLWCVVVLVIGLRHPPVYDESQPLDRRRQALAWVALLLFVLSFMPVPIDYVRFSEVGHQSDRPVVDQGHLHRGAEPAGRHLEAAAAEVFHQGVDQRLRLLGRGGAVEGGAAAAVDRAGEGELGDDQEGSSGGGGVEVHPAGVILEDAQAGELAGRGAHRLPAVAALDPHQHEEAAADRADRLAGHFHRRRADPLYDEAHF